MKSSLSRKTVVFIHGIFTNPMVWADWISYFQSQGFSCHAPAYPFHDGEPRRLRQRVNPALKGLTFMDVVNSFAQFIDKLPEKPILVGRSLGGLISQKLLGMGRASLAVAIDSAPPRGIFALKWSFFRSNFPTVNPVKGNSVCLPSVKWFHYACCNNMSLDKTMSLYDKFVVPESRNVARTARKRSARIDFARPHNPLLLIAGGKDHVIPPILNWKNYMAYTDSKSTTDFKLFPGKSHMLASEVGWEEVANYVISWIRSNFL